MCPVVTLLMKYNKIRGGKDTYHIVDSKNSGRWGLTIKTLFLGSSVAMCKVSFHWQKKDTDGGLAGGEAGLYFLSKTQTNTQ